MPFLLSELLSEKSSQRSWVSHDKKEDILQRIQLTHQSYKLSSLSIVFLTCTVSLQQGTQGICHLNSARTFRLRRVACREGNHSGNVRLPAANALTLRVTSVASFEMPSRCHSTAESPLQCWICSAVGVTCSIIACMPAFLPCAASYTTGQCSNFHKDKLMHMKAYSLHPKNIEREACP